MIVRVNKTIVVIILIMVLVFVSAGIFIAERNKDITPVMNIPDNATVILDAGHGGEDGGAVADDGTMEKTLNLDIALRLRDLLELAGYRVYMTRTEDQSLCAEKFIKKEDMANRIGFAEEHPQALFVSIHLNKFSMRQYSGAQVFYSDNHEDGFLLAKSIQESIRTNLQPNNTRQVKVGNDNSILLKSITQPAVIVEGGFLSNEAELKLLKTEQYRTKLAYCIFTGIISYHQMKEVK